MKEKTLFIVMHTHRFGTDQYLVRAKKMPREGDVVKKCEIDFEPDRGEYIEIDVAGKIIDI
jgi:hypothetical protein